MYETFNEDVVEVFQEMIDIFLRKTSLVCDVEQIEPAVESFKANYLLWNRLQA